jgi:hypothetical protein
MKLARRLPQVLLIVTFVGFSWLAMQVVHEVVARVTGAEVSAIVYWLSLENRARLC